jgi:hypothetical protein
MPIAMIEKPAMIRASRMAVDPGVLVAVISRHRTSMAVPRDGWAALR